MHKNCRFPGVSSTSFSGKAWTDLHGTAGDQLKNTLKFLGACSELHLQLHQDPPPPPDEVEEPVEDGEEEEAEARVLKPRIRRPAYGFRWTPRKGPLQLATGGQNMQEVHLHGSVLFEGRLKLQPSLQAHWGIVRDWFGTKMIPMRQLADIAEGCDVSSFLPPMAARLEQL